MVSAAYDVLRRLLGDAADRFSLRLVPSPGGVDEFSVVARDGEVDVVGSSAIALCRGAYHYLKQACHVQVCWSAEPVCLPARLPNFDQEAVVCPNRLRYYLSVCTFGYSTVWWDWARWEQEIDWMAVHGINMPLALVGQEFVWQRVFRELGLSDAEIAEHFSGPAFLPWHRLGNLNGYMGPLPQSWIDGQAELQRKILDRQRELGMMPVVPGFSGFVPAAIRRLYPSVELHSAEPWAGFPATTYLDPRSPLFVEIGARFIETYREVFGPVHHYLCETFAEQIPVIEPAGEVEYLRSIGQATWDAIRRGDPDGHWVMQGWPFYFARDFWSPDRAAALFDAVPAGRLIVLDQVTEAYEVWRHQPVLREKGWIHSVVHNYGQNTHLHGDLQGFADRAWQAMQDPDRGAMLGMGFVPEGIDQNPVVYELLSDIMWSSSRIDVATWIEGYARSRYGACPPSVLSAWRKLLGSVYGSTGGLTQRSSWRFRPGDQPLAPKVDTVAVFKAAESFEADYELLGHSRNYQRDLVDVTKTWLGGLADFAFEDLLAIDERNASDRDWEYEGSRELFFGVLRQIDLLLATLPEHRLSTWISAARAWGESAEEADLFEQNARTLITHWGQPFLFDYAIREWAGLTQDFHRERWLMYFDYLNRKEIFARNPDHASPDYPDFACWEAGWAATVTSSTSGSRTIGAGNESQPEAYAYDNAIHAARLIWGDYWPVIWEYVSSDPPETYRVHGPWPAVARESKLEILVDLGETMALAAIGIAPMFGQGFRGVYSAAVSRDGKAWVDLPGPGHGTYRGARFRIKRGSYRFVRFNIERELGEPSQMFQVVTFCPTGSA